METPARRGGGLLEVLVVPLAGKSQLHLTSKPPPAPLAVTSHLQARAGPLAQNKSRHTHVHELFEPRLQVTAQDKKNE